MAGFTPHEYAVLSAAAYKTSLRERLSYIQSQLGNMNFSVLPESDDDGLIVERNGHVAVAIRGTDPTNAGDLGNDAFIAGGVTGMSPRAEKYRQISDMLTHRFGPENVSYTGHSLGGAVAYQMGLETGSFTVTFNQGSSPLEHNILNNFYKEYIQGADASNIIMYTTNDDGVLDPFSVSVSGADGNLIRVKAKDPGGVIQNHGIDQFIDNISLDGSVSVFDRVRGNLTKRMKEDPNEFEKRRVVKSWLQDVVDKGLKGSAINNTLFLDRDYITNRLNDVKNNPRMVGGVVEEVKDEALSNLAKTKEALTRAGKWLKGAIRNPYSKIVKPASNVVADEIQLGYKGVVGAIGGEMIADIVDRAAGIINDGSVGAKLGHLGVSTAIGAPLTGIVTGVAKTGGGLGAGAWRAAADAAGDVGSNALAAAVGGGNVSEVLGGAISRGVGAAGGYLKQGIGTAIRTGASVGLQAIPGAGLGMLAGIGVQTLTSAGIAALLEQGIADPLLSRDIGDVVGGALGGAAGVVGAGVGEYATAAAASAIAGEAVAGAEMGAIMGPVGVAAGAVLGGAISAISAAVTAGERRYQEEKSRDLFGELYYNQENPVDGFFMYTKKLGLDDVDVWAKNALNYKDGSDPYIDGMRTMIRDKVRDVIQAPGYSFAENYNSTGKSYKDWVDGEMKRRKNEWDKTHKGGMALVRGNPNANDFNYDYEKKRLHDEVVGKLKFDNRNMMKYKLDNESYDDFHKRVSENALDPRVWELKKLMSGLSESHLESARSYVKTIRTAGQVPDYEFAVEDVDTLPETLNTMLSERIKNFEKSGEFSTQQEKTIVENYVRDHHGGSREVLEGLNAHIYGTDTPLKRGRLEHEKNEREEEEKRKREEEGEKERKRRDEAERDRREEQDMWERRVQDEWRQSEREREEAERIERENKAAEDQEAAEDIRMDGVQQREKQRIQSEQDKVEREGQERDDKEDERVNDIQEEWRRSEQAEQDRKGRVESEKERHEREKAEEGMRLQLIWEQQQQEKRGREEREEREKRDAVEQRRRERERKHEEWKREQEESRKRKRNQEDDEFKFYENMFSKIKVVDKDMTHHLDDLADSSSRTGMARGNYVDLSDRHNHGVNEGLHSLIGARGSHFYDDHSMESETKGFHKSTKDTRLTNALVASHRVGGGGNAHNSDIGYLRGHASDIHNGRVERTGAPRQIQPVAMKADTSTHGGTNTYDTHAPLAQHPMHIYHGGSSYSGRGG